MSDTNEKLVEYIKRLTTLTQEKKIPWYKANPTVFAWDANTSNKNTKVTLQEARTRVRLSNMQITEKRTYLFQVQDPRDKIANVSVDSKERSDYQAPLEQLYHAAGMSIDARTADLLEGLLDDLQ